MLTDRGYLYLCKTPDLPELPGIGTPDLEAFYELIDCIVRPPSYDWNPKEWAMISTLDDIPSYGAMCGFAVRCIRDKHQIASVVSDNHGRVAVNIVFDNICAFLDAQKVWRENLAPEPKRLELLETVAQSFATTHSCDDDLVASATDSFAVYLRLTLKLCTYYGQASSKTMSVSSAIMSLTSDTICKIMVL